MKTFDKPGPGDWEITKECRHPFARVVWPLLEASWGSGFKEAAADYGLFFHTRVGFANGFLYRKTVFFGMSPLRQLCLAPLAVGRGVGWRRVYCEVVLRRAMRDWFERVNTVFERRPWRKHLATWDDEIKPALFAEFAKLADVQPSALDDGALAAHLRACAATFVRAWRLADAATLTWLIPVGDYLARAQKDTTLSVLDLADSMTSSFASWLGPTTGAAAQEGRQRLAESVSALDDTLPVAEKLERLWEILRRTDPELHARCWVLSFSPVFGFDVVEPSLREMPAVLFENLRTIIRRVARDAPEPSAEPDPLMELRTEARSVLRVKDERELLVQGPARGLLRRALLEIGDRLVARERLAQRDHAFELSIDEAVDLLTRAADATVRRRAEEQHAYRVGTTVDRAPASLGREKANFDKMQDAGYAWLPDGANRLFTAFDVAGEWRAGPARARDRRAAVPAKENEVIRGIAASAGQYRGRARLVLSGTLAELERIEQGDVLVAPMTSTTFMPILSRVSAVVTDLGGPLSHPAIVAREYGIPSVVGCQTATERIADGDTVAVDGSRGTVEILGHG